MEQTLKKFDKRKKATPDEPKKPDDLAAANEHDPIEDAFSEVRLPTKDNKGNKEK